MKHLKKFEDMDYDEVRKDALKRLRKKSPSEGDVAWFNDQVDQFDGDVTVSGVDDDETDLYNSETEDDNNSGIDNTNEYEDLNTVKDNFKRREARIKVDKVRKQAKKLLKPKFKKHVPGTVAQGDTRDLNVDEKEWIKKNMKYQ
tara:strand:+ start:34496 stop:34927 length:432 start_codon:yes stop_codon:yes gene_type:complete